MTLCSLGDVYQCFGGVWRFNLQGRRVQTRDRKWLNSRTYILSKHSFFITIDSLSIPVVSSRYQCFFRDSYFLKLKNYILHFPPKVWYASTELLVSSVTSQKPQNINAVFFNCLFFCPFRRACWSSVQWTIVTELASLEGNYRPYFQIK